MERLAAQLGTPDPARARPLSAHGTPRRVHHRAARRCTTGGRLTDLTASP
jgi:hypothetical protein